MYAKALKFAAITASTITIAIASSAPAQALSLTGVLDFGGNVRVSTVKGGNFIFDFLQNESTRDRGIAGDADTNAGASSGSFANNRSALKIQDLDTRINYSSNPLSDFITGIQAQGQTLSFTLTDFTSFNDQRGRFNIIGGSFAGFFTDGSENVVADGILEGNFARKSGGTSNFTGSLLVSDAEDVPTPALLPGIVGIGAAALRKRKLAGAMASTEE